MEREAALCQWVPVVGLGRRGLPQADSRGRHRVHELTPQPSPQCPLPEGPDLTSQEDTVLAVPNPSMLAMSSRRSQTPIQEWQVSSRTVVRPPKMAQGSIDCYSDKTRLWYGGRHDKTGSTQTLSHAQEAG